MHALVLGGTGASGQEIVKLLLNDSVNVKATWLKKKKFHEPLEKNFPWDYSSLLLILLHFCDFYFRRSKSSFFESSGANRKR